MYGKNCIGRKISLLNENSEPSRSVRAHASNRASTPSFSPHTPELVHNEARDSRSLGSPSPLTSSLNVFHEQLACSHADNLPQQYFVVNHRYCKIEEPSAPKYAQPDAFLALSFACASPTPIPVQIATTAQQPAQQLHHSPTSPSTESSCVSDAEPNNNCSPAIPKKKRHPCPLAKQYSCLEFFTTSGHAARHARKHTGDRDVLCPDCNQAFTRKDNMKQHRRTHKTGRIVSHQSHSSDHLTSPEDHQATVEQNQQQTRTRVRCNSAVATRPVALPHQQPAAQQTQQQQLAQPAISTFTSCDSYFNTVDLSLTPSIPISTMISNAPVRPPLHQTTCVSSIDDCLLPAQTTGNPDALSLAYQSSGRPDGLYNLALAASEHRQLSEVKVKRLPVTI